MIVPMKKVSLLLSSSAKDAFLGALRRAGVVHVVEVPHQADHSVQAIQEEIDSCVRALAILSGEQKGMAGQAPLKRPADVIAFARTIVSSAKEREEALKQVQDIDQERSWFGPWQGFEPADIETFREQGVFVRLYRLSAAQRKDLSDDQRAKLYTVSEEAGTVCAAYLTRDEQDRLAFDEIPLPRRGMRELQQARLRAEETIRKTGGEIAAGTHMVATIGRTLAQKEKELVFARVRAGMPSAEGIASLQGFCPHEAVRGVIALCEREGAGYLIEDPGQDDEVPTLIRNPRWVRIIQPIFTFMNTVPGYREFDVSLPFLVFFSLFFALLIGDAGYGLLFFGVTAFARRRLPQAPREPFVLLYVLSGATILWGALTGTWFGSVYLSQVPLFKAITIKAVGSFTGADQTLMMYICFIIGAVHLSIAHLMQTLRLFPSPKALAQLGWIMTVWGLFFVVCTLIIDKPMAPVTPYLLWIGIASVFLFTNFQRNILKGVVSSLIEVPLSILSAFSDIISYLRLFAVGFATVVVASSFNDMAIGSGIHSVLGGLAAAMILFLGHTLNITLSCMAIIVHGLRLNLLEFSGHLGMQWTGTEYKPFSE